MKIKNYKEWDYTLVLIALIFLIAFLASCSNSKAVYQTGHSWKPAAERSEITGWAREFR